MTIGRKMKNDKKKCLTLSKINENMKEKHKSEQGIDVIINFY